MFSNDQNIETISRMLLNAKRYGDMRLESFERSSVDKLSKVVSALITGAVLFAIALILVVFVSAAIVVAIAPRVGGYLAALLIIGGVYVLLLTLVYSRRRSWIAMPVLRYFCKVFFADKADKPVPTEKEMMEARQQVMDDYSTLTAPPPRADNAFEQAIQTAGKAWSIADGVITGYKLYKKMGRLFRRRR